MAPWPYFSTMVIARATYPTGQRFGSEDAVTIVARCLVRTYICRHPLESRFD